MTKQYQEGKWLAKGKILTMILTSLKMHIYQNIGEKDNRPYLLKLPVVFPLCLF